MVDPAMVYAVETWTARKDKQREEVDCMEHRRRKSEPGRLTQVKVEPVSHKNV